jgi:hypothetical protein
MLAGALAVVWLTTLFGAAVEVEGDTLCPRPGDVQNALAQLIGAGAGDGPGLADVAVLTGDDTSVRLQLRRDADGVIQERTLPDGLTCSERATAAAVILAAWEARLDSSTAGPLLRRAAARGAAGGPDLTAVGGRPALGWSLGLLEAVNPSGIAAAAIADVSVSWPAAPLGVSGGILLVSSHSLDLISGQVNWRRYGLTTDVLWRLASSRSIWAEARAGLALTVVEILGQQGSSLSIDPGATAGLRVALGTPAPLLWLHFSAAYWPRGQVVYAQRTGAFAASSPLIEEQRLPPFDVFIGVGVSFGRGR